jgi:Bacterial transcriptional activator domain
VVVLSGPTDESLAADLVAVTSPPGRGLGVLSDHAIPGAGWVLEASGDGWTLAPLGLAVQPIGLTAVDAAVLVELLADAEAPVATPTPPRRRPATPFVERDWQLMVRVLGPVDVVNRDGVSAEFAKSKALELVAWLADRSSTATRGAARAALWETIVRDGTFANVVSEARRALATLSPPPTGTEWIARTLTEMLPLHEDVVSDAALLEARLAHARRSADARHAAAVLKEGLELVRDVPFAGSAYVWPDAEGRASSLLLLIVAAAGEFSQRCLELGDHQGLFWATAKGLSVIPGHEELIALRMRGHAATGDYAAIRTEFEQYERVLNADSWSDGEPSPKLVALRKELLSPAATYAKAV